MDQRTGWRGREGGCVGSSEVVCGEMTVAWTGKMSIETDQWRDLREVKLTRLGDGLAVGNEVSRIMARFRTHRRRWMVTCSNEKRIGL